jgi:hypothetical protein
MQNSPSQTETYPDYLPAISGVCQHTGIDSGHTYIILVNHSNQGEYWGWGTHLTDLFHFHEMKIVTRPSDIRYRHEGIYLAAS